MAIRISVANDFTMTPGGRLIKEGPFSGEAFREEILLPAFLRALEDKEKLIVDLDGGYGYGSSFLDESFGGLARKLRDPQVLSIEIVSQEEPELIDKIHLYMEEGLKE